MVIDIVVGAIDLRFDSRASQIARRGATAETFLPSCVGQSLSCREGTCHSLLALAQGWASFSHEGPDLEKLWKSRVAC